jgi:hypothetical protein
MVPELVEGTGRQYKTVIASTGSATSLSTFRILKKHKRKNKLAQNMLKQLRNFENLLSFLIHSFGIQKKSQENTIWM